MDWHRRYEAGDTPWDEGGPHPALVEFLERDGPLPGRVLVPGCGLGHEVRALAARGVNVTGLDIAPGAIQRARALPRAGGEDYRLGDFFHMPPEDRGAYDWLVEHTCFCAIDPALRPAYAAAAAQALKPGGRLFAIFYLRPAADHQPPFGVEPRELDALFAAAFVLEREWTPARTFEDREGRELVRLLRRK